MKELDLLLGYIYKASHRWIAMSGSAGPSQISSHLLSGLVYSTIRCITDRLNRLCKNATLSNAPGVDLLQSLDSNKRCAKVVLWNETQYSSRDLTRMQAPKKKMWTSFLVPLRLSETLFLLKSDI